MPRRFRRLGKNCRVDVWVDLHAIDDRFKQLQSAAIRFGRESELAAVHIAVITPVLFVLYFALLALGFIPRGGKKVRVRIEIKFQGRERHLYDHTESFFVADLLFPDGLTGNAPCQHLLINTPAAAE